MGKEASGERLPGAPSGRVRNPHPLGKLRSFVRKIASNAIRRMTAHPAVGEAVCFGVPHPTWGEEVEAAVVLRETSTATEADLLGYCRERMADYKRPKKIHITKVIPRTATGKIQRRIVAQAYGEKSL